MRAIRGAISIEQNSEAAISSAVARLCRAITRANELTPERIISVIFTLTPDLTACFPARTARERGGWGEVPMICAQEIPVPDAPPRLCRVLVHVRGRGPSRHVYLGEALNLLRPDLAKPRPRPRRKRRSGK